MQVFLYLPAFVSVFLWFLWLLIHLWEWTLGIANRVMNNVQRFGHNLIDPLLGLAMPEACLIGVVRSSHATEQIGIERFKRDKYRRCVAKVQRNFPSCLLTKRASRRKVYAGSYRTFVS